MNALERAASEPSAGKIRTKILIVDDRRDNLIAMKAALKGCDYDLFETQSGFEAVDLANRHDFAVVLLDVQMPRLDGFQTANLMRQQFRSCRTPIVFVTAIHRTEAYERLGYGAGAVDYLFKPINVEILRAKVAVFAELYQKTVEIECQADQLKNALLKERENQILREALIARDEFLSIASHELKTPLTPLCLQMQSFIELYRTGAETKVPRERLLRMLMTSHGQVERLTRLVNELVDVSRLRSGNLQLNRQEVEVHQLLDSVLVAYAEQMKSSGCELRVDLKAGIKGHWDRFRIEQVIINLLTNAMKYGAGKPITVRVWEEAAHALISVSDLGIGIRKEDQERIFQRFERAVSAQNYGGLGLGLYIASQMVHLHQGTISVLSHEGQGSTFTVRLPITHIQG